MMRNSSREMQQEEGGMSALPYAQKRSSLTEIIVGWWRKWTGFNPAYSDISCCVQADVERIARDVGVSAAELRALAKLGPDSADLLQRRMAALKLDQNKVFHTEPGTFHDLQRICSMCESHKRCAHDMAQSSINSAWEDYCPNAATLQALNAMPRTAQRKS
jgi:hypothetical protein